MALDAKTGKVNWSIKTGDPGDRRNEHRHRAAGQGQGHRRRLGRRIWRARPVTAYSLKDGKEIWKAYSTGPDAEMLVDPEKTTMLGKAHRQATAR